MSVPQIRAVRLSPREELGQKELVVLGPSLGTSTVMWDAVARLLGDDYDILGWDLPGHGVSPAAEPDAEFSVGELADAVVGLVDSILPGTASSPAAFHYAGDSVGGATGAELALRHPDRLLTLAMFCSSARFNGAEGYAERAELVAKQGTAVRLQASAEIWFAPGFLAEHPAESSRLLHTLRDTDRFGYAAVCRAIAAYDVRDRFTEITVPFLAVAGQFDSVCPFSDAQWMAEHAQQGTAVELAGVAHIAPTENPAAVAELLRKHFAGAAANAPHDPRAGVVQPGATQREVYDGGMVVRREVLGDAHVDRANAGIDEFTSEFQNMITRIAWGGIWTRPGLSRQMRSVAVLTAMIAHGHWDEFAMHVRAALRNGLTRDEIKEVILQSAIYCGVPSANTAFKVAQKTLADIDAASSEEQQ